MTQWAIDQLVKALEGGETGRSHAVDARAERGAIRGASARGCVSTLSHGEARCSRRKQAQPSSTKLNQAEDYLSCAVTVTVLNFFIAERVDVLKLANKFP